MASSKPLSKNPHLIQWVKKMTALCQPDAIHWVDGSQKEYNALCAMMVKGGTFIRLNQKKWPGCYLARSDASDVARVEDRTFMCSHSKEAAGPTNNWVNPYEMKRTLRALFHGCMKGRTMYVLPFSMGPLGSSMSQIGVQLTDSPYEDMEWGGMDFSREKFEELQAFDRAAWRAEVLGHEEHFLDVHAHLPKELIFERELLICRM